jgi:hypothetical protein
VESNGCGNEKQIVQRFANVDTDVEAVWMELLLHNITTLHAKFTDLIMFFRFKIKI